MLIQYKFTEVGRGVVGIDNEQCFIKLVKSISEGSAFVRELVQNAFDATYSAPTVILHTNASEAELAVIDERGMDRVELEALTEVGYSTKLDSNKRDLRGEFGTGFILALSPHIGAKFVEVRTTCENREWCLQVSYPDADYNRMPVKTLKILKEPCSERTSVKVHFTKDIQKVRQYLSWMAQAPGRPVRVEINGIKQEEHPPLSEWEVGDFEYYTRTESGDDLFIRTNKPEFYTSIDGLSLSLKDLPVLFQTSSYHFLTGYDAGDHMPQNEYGHVYLDWNEIYVNAKKLSLNSSRDTVIRDDAFDTFKLNLNTKAKAPLLIKVNRWVDENVEEIVKYEFRSIFRSPIFLSERELYAHQDFANLKTFSYRLRAFINGSETCEEYTKFFNHLLSRLLFKSTTSDSRDLSISSLREKSHGCIIFNEEMYEESLEKMVRSMFKDKEHPIVINESVFFGGHQLYAVNDILRSVAPDMMHSLADIVTNWGVYQKLIDKGILNEPSDLFFKRIEPRNGKESQLLTDVAGLMGEMFRSLKGNRAGILQLNIGLCRTHEETGILQDLVETRSDGNMTLDIMLYVDNPIYKNALNVDNKAISYYLVSLIVFELCHVVRHYMRIRGIGERMRWEYAPAEFEDKFNTILLKLVEKKEAISVGVSSNWI
jgi:hypothetical protein